MINTKAVALRASLPVHLLTHTLFPHFDQFAFDLVPVAQHGIPLWDRSPFFTWPLPAQKPKLRAAPRFGLRERSCDSCCCLLREHQTHNVLSEMLQQFTFNY